MSRGPGQKLTVVLMLALASCSKTGDRSRTVEPPREGDTAQTSPSAQRLLSAVPGQALGIAVLDLPKNLGQLAADGMLMPMRENLRDELSRELGQFFSQRLGARIDDVSAVVGFLHGTDRPHGAAMLAPIKGKLNTATLARELGGGDLEVAQHEDILIIGDRVGVAAALASLQSSAGASKLAAWLAKEAPGAAAAVALNVAELPDKGKAAFGPAAGLRRAMASVGGELKIIGEADTDTLTALKGQIELFKGMALQAAKGQKEAASAPGQPFGAGAGAIVGYYYARNLAESLKPVVEGERLSMSLPLELGNSMPIVPIVGILAAVSIPAFMKYIKKSKATEARANLHRIANGTWDHYLSTGKLPPTVGPTPPGSCCEGGKDKCAPDAKLWNHPTWRALAFDLLDPHRYSYRFDGRGDQFVVTARGDLDCDGVMSTFQLSGTVSGGGVSLNPLSVQDELE